MSKYYVEYGALQANGKRLIECATSALDAKKITEDFAREIADALNGREAWECERAEVEGAARKSRKIAQMIRRLIGDLRKEKTISADVAKDAFDMIDDLAIELLITPPRNCDVGTAEERKGENDGSK